MRTLSLLLLFAAALTACNNNSTPAVDVAKEQQALLAADSDFCATGLQQGWLKAAQKYYADDAVAIGPNQPVAIGKAAILKHPGESHMDSVTTLVWKAEKAAVAASGDLGYTWGYYHMSIKTMSGNDTTFYGAYATIWKKTADGWRAIVDQNNDTPKP